MIIGGGIGGPVAAVALQRAGIESVIYDAHRGPAESLGLFLGLGVNGMRVLQELDLLEPLRWTDTIPTPPHGVLEHHRTMSWIHDHALPWDEPVMHSGRSDHYEMKEREWESD